MHRSLTDVVAGMFDFHSCSVPAAGSLVLSPRSRRDNNMDDLCTTMLVVNGNKIKTAATVSTKSHGDDDCDCGGIDEDSDDNNDVIIRSWPLDIVVRRPLVLSALSTKVFWSLSHMPTRARRTHTLARVSAASLSVCSSSRRWRKHKF